jgi:NADPH-dependent curcumin reductase CurA
MLEVSMFTRPTYVSDSSVLGDILDMSLARLNRNARIVLCGTSKACAV